LTNVTISGNSTGDGGDRNIGFGSGAQGGQGGGVFVSTSSVLTASHVTLAGNLAGKTGANTGTTDPRDASDGRGGAVATAPTNGVFPGGTARFTSSILSGNGPFACAGAVAAGSDSIGFDPVDDSCPGRDVDPQLGALGDNGGPVQTRALPAGSPALDIGRADACAATDARGTARPQGSGCDAGAFEREVPVEPPGPGPGPGADITAPVVELDLRRQTLGKALANGYAVHFTTNEAGTAVAELRVAGKRVGRKAVTVATVGANRAVVRLNRKTRRKYKRRKRLRMTVRVTATDAAGNSSLPESRRVTLRRR
jgi:hypothetical protein